MHPFLGMFDDYIVLDTLTNHYWYIALIECSLMRNNVCTDIQQELFFFIMTHEPYIRKTYVQNQPDYTLYIVCIDLYATHTWQAICFGLMQSC